MSYLRGPLTRDQVALLTRDAAVPAATAPAPPPETDATPVAPSLAAEIPVAYLDVAAPWAAQLDAAANGAQLRAYLAARVSIRFDDAKAALDEREEYEALYGPLDEGLDLDPETVVEFDDRDFVAAAPDPAGYVFPTVPIDQSSFFREAERDIARRLAARQALELHRNAKLKLTSRPGETPEQFAQRCDEAAQAAADAEAGAGTPARERVRLETAAMVVLAVSFVLPFVGYLIGSGLVLASKAWDGHEKAAAPLIPPFVVVLGGFVVLAGAASVSEGESFDSGLGPVEIAVPIASALSGLLSAAYLSHRLQRPRAA